MLCVLRPGLSKSWSALLLAIKCKHAASLYDLIDVASIWLWLEVVAYKGRPEGG